MPKKRISSKTPRKPKATPSFDYESEEFLSQVDALAFEDTNWKWRFHNAKNFATR